MSDSDPELSVRRLTEELAGGDLSRDSMDNTAAGDKAAGGNFGEDVSSPEPGSGVPDPPDGDTGVVAEEGPRAGEEPAVEPQAAEPATPDAASVPIDAVPITPSNVDASPRNKSQRLSIAENIDAHIIKDRKLAIEEAKLYAADRQPRVLSKPGKPEYEKRVGEKYPLLCPNFHPDKPCLADLGIGVSLYFSTLKRLMMVFFLMFLLGIPSLTVTFLANPNAATEAAEPPNNALAALSVFTVAGMFKQNTEQEYGCTAEVCTMGNNATVDTEVLVSMIVWMDLFSCLVFVISIPFIVEQFERRAALVDEHNVTASDYSVWVWGVPPNVTQEQVKAHFDKYDGTVCPPKGKGGKVVPHPGGEEADPPMPPPPNRREEGEEGVNERPATSGDAAGAGEYTAIPIQAVPAAEETAAGAPAAPEEAADIEAAGGAEGAPSGDAAAQAETPEAAAAEATIAAEGADAAEEAAAAEVEKDPLEEVLELTGEVGGGDGEEAVAVNAEDFGSVEEEGDRKGAAGPSGEGGVADVFLARADAKVFKLLKDRNEEQKEIGQLTAALSQLESEKKKTKVQKKIAKLQVKLDKVRDKIDKIAKKGTDEGFNPVVCAFVMFNTQVAQLDCLRHYAEPHSHQGGLFCRKQFPEFQLKLPDQDATYPLRVVEAPEPSTLLWENLECSPKNRAIRRFLSSCCSFLIILISFGVIVGGKSLTNDMKSAEALCLTDGYTESCNLALNWKAEVSHACPNGRETCALWEAWDLNPYWRVSAVPLDLDDAIFPPTTYTMIGHECRFLENNQGVTSVDKTNLDDACVTAAEVNSSHWLALINAGWRDPSFENKTDCVMCLCAALQTSQNLLWLETFDIPMKKGSLRSAADEAFCTPQAEAFFTFVGIQAAAIVIVVIFNTLMKTTTQLLAVFERHHTLDDQEKSVTFAVFIGQFINTALVAVIVYANIPAVGDKVPDFPVLAGPFGDFTTGWYFLVGVQIMTTVIVNVVMPAVPLVLEVVLKLFKPITTKGIVLQSELNNAYLGSDFLLSARYGMLLNSMFTCYMYSSGMPVLLLIGVFLFFVTFMVDKIQLLRVSSSPPQYDARLAIYVVKLFKWAILIHMLIGCWVFSSSEQIGPETEGMFPRPVLSQALEDYSENLVEEAFGCQNIGVEATCVEDGACWWNASCGVETNLQVACEAIAAQGECGGKRDCFWNATASKCSVEAEVVVGCANILQKNRCEARTGECAWSAACQIDYDSQAYQDYATFDFVPRMFNRVVFPYFVFTFLFLVHSIAQITPARIPVNLATYALFMLIKKIVKAVTSLCSGGKVQTDEDRVDGDHGMPPYKDAVQDGAFGTFDHNYDVTLIGQYEKTLSVGDSLAIYLNVSPHNPLLKVEPPRVSKSRPTSPEPSQA